jgi:malate dehydrogenase (oxaloacetate-decarboxylating)
MATKKTGIIKKNYNQESLSLHKLHGGKIALASKFPLKNRDDLSRAYTPGVGAVCMAIKDDVKLVKTLTLKKNTIAVVSDGTAVLGFGDIGPAPLESLLWKVKQSL